jgi:CHAT domain-containing protein/lipopolysaccharide biosynthesis regulator YciM
MSSKETDMRTHHGPGACLRALLAVTLCLVAARAGDDAAPPSGKQPDDVAADAVLEAVRAKDAERLKVLASEDEPDPWHVADVLIARGEIDAAEEFARAAPRPDVEKLPAYVAAQRGKSAQKEARALLRTVLGAASEGKHAAILDLTESLPPERDGIIGLRLVYLRGAALAKSGKHREAYEIFVAAAESVGTLGWLACQSRMLHGAGVSATHMKDLRMALARWEEKLAVEERRSSPKGTAATLSSIGVTYSEFGEYERAAEYLERARALFEQTGAKSEEAAALSSLGTVHGRLGNVSKANEYGKRALKLHEELRNNIGIARTLISIGNVQLESGDYRGSVDCAERALAAIEGVEDRQELARILSQASGLLSNSGQNARAIVIAERALLIYEESRDPAGIAHMLTGLGLMHEFLSQYREAREFGERALKFSRDNGQPLAEAHALANLGGVCAAQGDYQKSLEYQEQALKMHEARKDETAVATTQLDMAGAYCQLGEYLKALDFASRALAWYERRGDPGLVATALGHLGAIHAHLGDYPKSLEYHVRVLEIAREIGWPVREASALGNIGAVRAETGDYAAAIDCMSQALKLLQVLEDTSGVVKQMINIARVQHARGDYASAIDLATRAKTLAVELGLRQEVARALNQLGNIHESKGDYARAIELQEETLKLRQEIGDPAGTGATLNDLATLYGAVGDHAKALECGTRALEIMRALGRKQDQATCAGNIGILLVASGDLKRALESLESAREIKDKLGLRPGVATTLGDIGNLQRLMGDYDAALGSLARARQMHRELGAGRGGEANLVNIGLVHEARGELARAVTVLTEAREEGSGAGHAAAEQFAQMALARVYRKQGSPREAIQAAREAITRLPKLVSQLGDELGSTARQQWADLFVSGALAARDLGDARECAFFLESGRAGALLESFSTREALMDDVIEPAQRAAELEARSEETRCAAELRRAYKDGDRAAYEAAAAELATARRDLDAIIERIQRASAKVANVTYPAPDDLTTIQSRLASGDTLVLYCLQPKEAIALVVSRDRARIVRLAPGEEIARACQALHADSAAENPDAAVAELKAKVIDPLKLGPDCKRLLVSPDGELSFVPFSLLAGDREVASEPSGTVYGMLLEERKARGEGVLALGDPAYKGEVVTVLRSGRRLGRLPASGDEARAVGTVTLLREEATETRLLEEIAKRPRWRAVHLACHGFVDAEQPRRSALAVAPDGSSDGLLSVLDVFRMKCPADLVVLSACETGKGKQVRGEGLMGLTRAFMYAGAPRVIASLWKVDDAATRALMERFYERWNAGASAAAALREAQAHVRAQKGWEHPAFWAAWVLWGLPD